MWGGEEREIEGPGDHVGIGGTTWRWGGRGSLVSTIELEASI